MIEIDGQPLDELILAAWTYYANSARFIARKSDSTPRALSSGEQKVFRLVYLEAARRTVGDEPTVLTGDNTQLATFVADGGLVQTRDQIAGAVHSLNCAVATSCRGRVERAAATYVVTFHVAETDTHFFWFDLERESAGTTDVLLRVPDYVRARNVENVLNSARDRAKALILADADARGKKALAERFFKALYMLALPVVLVAAGAALAYTTIPRFRTWIDRVILRKTPSPEHVRPQGRRALHPVTTASPARVTNQQPPTSPPSPPTHVLHGVRAGGYIFVPRGGQGLQAFGLTDGAPPRLAWLIPVRTALGVAMSGPFLYVAGDADGVHVIDTRRPPAQALRTTLLTATPARDVAVEGSYLLVAAAQGGLDIYDLRFPEAPRIVSRLLDAEPLSGGGFAGSMEKFVFVGAGYAHALQTPADGVGAVLGTYDISDARHPRRVSGLVLEETTTPIAVFHQSIVMLTRQSVLWCGDAIHLENLRRTASTRVPEEIESLVAVDQQTIVAVGVSGSAYFVRFIVPSEQQVYVMPGELEVTPVDARAAKDALQEVGVLLLDKDMRNY